MTFSFFAGYAVRDYRATAEAVEALRARYTYMDVLIVARHDDHTFTLQPKWMDEWGATTCTPVDWQAGQKMKFVTYVQHTDGKSSCKDVSLPGAYEFYMQDGKRLIFTKEIAHGY
jgi:hypothetical protein